MNSASDNAQQQDSDRQDRVSNAVVASYLHQLSERHTPDESPPKA